MQAAWAPEQAGGYPERPACVSDPCTKENKKGNTKGNTKGKKPRKLFFLT
jgi:hypothetical protein